MPPWRSTVAAAARSSDSESVTSAATRERAVAALARQALERLAIEIDQRELRAAPGQQARRLGTDAAAAPVISTTFPSSESGAIADVRTTLR